MKLFITVLTVSLFLLGCISNGSVVEESTIVPDKQPQNIRSWSIIFKYKNTVTITKEQPDGGIEKTVEDHGQSSFDLLLLGDIYYKLKYKHGINISKEKENSEGIIPAVDWYTYYVEIAIYKADTVL